LSFEDVMASGSLPPGFPMARVDGYYYWDGGLFSNTPLSPAINRLEELDEDNADIKRELIVIELFPMEVPIPENMPDVINRMLQLQYTNRLKLDSKLFKKFNEFIDLVQEIDKEIARDHPIRQNEGYKELRKHKKIDAFKVISANLQPELTNAGDFSKASIDERIEAGYQEAIEQRIGEHTPTDEQLRTI
jgi:NTE family protein